MRVRCFSIHVSGFCADLSHRGHHRKGEDGHWYAHLDEDTHENEQENEDAEGS